MMMDKSKYIIILLLATLIGCSPFSVRQDWDFVEGVGGLIVGQDKNPNWLLLRGDVSGVYEFTTKPKLVNSAMALESVKKIVKGDKIQIYIVTTLINEKNSNTKIHGVDISGLKKGKYMVQYLNPDNTTVDLKEIYVR